MLLGRTFDSLPLPASAPASAHTASALGMLVGGLGFVGGASALGMQVLTLQVLLECL